MQSTEQPDPNAVNVREALRAALFYEDNGATVFRYADPRVTTDEDSFIGSLIPAILAAVAEVRPRGTVTDAEMLRLGKVAWVAHHGNTAWAKSFVEDRFSPVGDLPEEARDMIAVARAVLDAAREARS